jgi:hypothetical protein
MTLKDSVNIYRANNHLWRQYGGCKYVLAARLYNWSTVLKWKGMIWKKYWHLKLLTQYSKKQIEVGLIWPWSIIQSECCYRRRELSISVTLNCPTKYNCFIFRPKLTTRSSLSLTINITCRSNSNKGNFCLIRRESRVLTCAYLPCLNCLRHQTERQFVPRLSRTWLITLWKNLLLPSSLVNFLGGGGGAGE